MRITRRDMEMLEEAGLDLDDCDLPIENPHAFTCSGGLPCGDPDCVRCNPNAKYLEDEDEAEK